MKLSEEKETKTTTPIIPSKPKGITLKPYEFDPKDLDKLIKQHEKIDPKTDIQAAKKSRALIKKKIAEIKRVHTTNKKDVLEFKRDMDAYDLAKFEALTSGLSSLFDSLDQGIKNIENGVILREAEVSNNIMSLQNEFTTKIFSSTTIEEIQAVQIEINHITATAADYDNRIGEVDSIKTSLILKASGRHTEIHNAGGSINNQNVKPIDTDPMDGDMGRRNTDTELLNFLQNAGSAKGWVVNINPNTGAQVYQVDDPNATKDLRVALEDALSKYQSM